MSHVTFYFYPMSPCHFYKTLTSLSTLFIKPHVGLLQLLKWPCWTSFFTHVEAYTYVYIYHPIKASLSALPLLFLILRQYRIQSYYDWCCKNHFLLCSRLQHQQAWISLSGIQTRSLPEVRWHRHGHLSVRSPRLHRSCTCSWRSVKPDRAVVVGTPSGPHQYTESERQGNILLKVFSIEEDQYFSLFLGINKFGRVDLVQVTILCLHTCSHCDLRSLHFYTSFRFTT